jgi:crotonobetainyl-CoA:carnitine CoA-transferase CaiB-like acyl-CoA transferase
MTDSRIGEIAIPDVVPRLSGTPGEIRWLGEGLGAQNEEIFKGLLELSHAEIDDLRTSGVI